MEGDSGTAAACSVGGNGEGGVQLVLPGEAPTSRMRYSYWDWAWYLEVECIAGRLGFQSRDPLAPSSRPSLEVHFVSGVLPAVHRCPQAVGTSP